MHTDKQADRQTDRQRQRPTSVHACAVFMRCSLAVWQKRRTETETEAETDMPTYIYIHVRVFTCMHVGVCVRARTYIYIHVRVFTCMHVGVYVRAPARVCVCVSGCKPIFGMPLTFNTCWNGSPKYSARLLARQLEVPTQRYSQTAMLD